jgi:hypothetical protein
MAGDEALIARFETLERLLRGDLRLRVLGKRRTKLIGACAYYSADKASESHEKVSASAHG